MAMTDVKIRWAVWSRGWMGDERQTVKVPDGEKERAAPMSGTYAVSSGGV